MSSGTSSKPLVSPSRLASNARGCQRTLPRPFWLGPLQLWPSQLVAFPRANAGLVPQALEEGQTLRPHLRRDDPLSLSSASAQPSRTGLQCSSRGWPLVNNTVTHQSRKIH